MMRNLILTVLITGLLLSMHVLADEGDWRETAQTQLEMNEGAAAEYAAADAELNDVYRQLMAQLEKAQQMKLMEAEKAWIRFRDADAELQAGFYEGGSIQPMIHSMALTELTRQRIQNLHDMHELIDN